MATTRMGRRRKFGGFVAEMAELADARDLKSLGPKARPGSIPGLGTNHGEAFQQSGASSAIQTRGGAAW